MESSPLKNQGKNKFSPAEDLRLCEIVDYLGHQNWVEVAVHMPGRNARQCRERWMNYVNPTIRQLPWTASEELLLEQKLVQLGPKWQVIASFFPNRSRNYVKNHWATKQRRLRRQTRMTEPGDDQLATEDPIPSDPDPDPVRAELTIEDLFAASERESDFWRTATPDYF
jgi:hypothetical protein